MANNTRRLEQRATGDEAHHDLEVVKLSIASAINDGNWSWW